VRLNEQNRRPVTHQKVIQIRSSFLLWPISKLDPSICARINGRLAESPAGKVGEQILRLQQEGNNEGAEGHLAIMGHYGPNRIGL
jgi:hypothetical protein